jgi:hypothetical protein
MKDYFNLLLIQHSLDPKNIRLLIIPFQDGFEWGSCARWPVQQVEVVVQSVVVQMRLELLHVVVVEAFGGVGLLCPVGMTFLVLASTMPQILRVLDQGGAVDCRDAPSRGVYGQV